MWRNDSIFPLQYLPDRKFHFMHFKATLSNIIRCFVFIQYLWKQLKKPAVREKCFAPPF